MKIEKVHLEDYHKIVKLNDKNNLISLERTDWENLWKKNPYLKNNKIEWTLGWKLINNNNELVGLILNIPFIFKYKKKEILAAVCSNYVINENYRSYSLKLRHLFLNQLNVDLYITNTANQKSEKIMLAFKAKKIFQYDYQDRLFYILKKRKFLVKIFFNLNFLFILNFIKNLFKREKNYKIKDIAFKEEREVFNVDDLENKLNLENDLCSSKDRNWLNWKYNFYIKRKKLISLKVFKNEALIGQIIMIKNFHKKENLNRLSIVEIIGFNKNAVYLKESLKKCILIGKENELDVIDVIGFKKEIRDVISEVGFFKKKSFNFNFLVKNDNESLDKILFNSLDKLNLSVSDGDGIFYY